MWGASLKLRTIILVLALVCILSITTPTAYEEESLGYEVLPIKENMYLSNEVHGPIQILSDSEFVSQATAEDWQGDGSEGDPYLIEAYNISTDSSGIRIINVSLYFKIQDCNIESVSSTTNPGIYTNNVTHCEIRNTTVSGKSYGLYIDHDSNVLVSGCTISGCPIRGVYLQSTGNFRIENSEVYGNQHGIWVQATNSVEIFNTDVHDNSQEGIYLIGSDFCTITESRSNDNGGAGMFIYDSQNCTVESSEVYGNSDVLTGVHLLISHNATIRGNEVHDNMHVGIFLADSNFGIIHDNDVWNNSDLGIELSSAGNCSIINNDVWENGFWPTYIRQSGILIEDSQYSVVEGNRIWNNSYAGVFLNNEANNNEIIGNSIYNNTDHGIYAYGSSHCDAIGNDIWGNGWKPTDPACGIYVWNSGYWLIEGNRIWNNTGRGIYFESYDTTVIRNRIWNNSDSGIFVDECSDSLVSENTVFANNYGIELIAVNTNVTNNIIYDNEYGIYVYYSGNCRIYGNDVGWNTVNAYEWFTFPGMFILWHNNQSIGNWWSDYSGSGSYGITNGTHFINYDLYPRKSLDLNASTSLDYEFTETGNVMVWPAQALNPSHFEVYANGSLLYSEVWDGTNIETNLDNLAVGYYNITMIAYHVSGHWISATSSADVTDTIAPAWVAAPTNQEITVGDSFSYQVTATDASGIGSYSVNDTTHFQISGTGLITNVVLLEEGVYGLEITVVDIYGNELTATITITVVATPPGGVDTIMLIVLSLSAGVLVLIIAIVLYGKKRG